MTSTPPPPPHRPGRMQEKPPVAGWIVPVAGVLAVIGVFTPWFRPEVTASGGGKSITKAVENALYSWKDGKIGLIAPIVLAILAVAVVGLMTGRTVSRFERGSSGPIVTAARASMIAGGISLAAVVIAWFMVPSQYSFSDGGREYSWDDYIKAIQGLDGVDSAGISRAPQLGYFLTVAAALVALIGGTGHAADAQHTATGSAAERSRCAAALGASGPATGRLPERPTGRLPERPAGRLPERPAGRAAGLGRTDPVGATVERPVADQGRLARTDAGRLRPTLLPLNRRRAGLRAG